MPQDWHLIGVRYMRIIRPWPDAQLLDEVKSSGPVITGQPTRVGVRPKNERYIFAVGQVAGDLSGQLEVLLDRVPVVDINRAYDRMEGWQALFFGRRLEPGRTRLLVKADFRAGCCR